MITWRRLWPALFGSCANNAMRWVSTWCARAKCDKTVPALLEPPAMSFAELFGSMMESRL